MNERIEELIRELGDAKTCKCAEDALLQIGEPAVPALIGVFAKRDVAVSICSVTILKRIGAPAIPKLVEALANENSKVRWRADKALGNICPRNAGDLRLLEVSARKFAGEHRSEIKDGKFKEEMRKFRELHAYWKEILGSRLKGLVLDKRFPLPKIKESGEFGRVNRVRRLMHPGRA